MTPNTERCLVFAMLFTLVASCLSQVGFEGARAKYENGKLAFEQQKFADAESAFKESYSLRAFPITAYFLSCTYVQLQKRNDAGHFAQLALQGTPKLIDDYSRDAQKILKWSKKPVARETDLENEAHLDTVGPNPKAPTEESFPSDDTPTQVQVAEGLTVLRGSGPEIFLVVEGRRRWIPNQTTFDVLGLDGQSVKTIPDEELNSIPRGADYPSLAGTLVKGTGPDVYQLENGKRRLIPDMETFKKLGLRWESVQYIPDQDLSSIPVGAPIPK
jgi:hypothetical protein